LLIVAYIKITFVKFCFLNKFKTAEVAETYNTMIDEMNKINDE